MTTIKIPGLIDIHTHLRVPGGEHKEDFASGTAAALAGGITMVLAMPNTSPPLTNAGRLAEARRLAAAHGRCDIGLFAGASPESTDQLPAAAPLAVALKIYLNDTFGPLRVDDLPALRACFEMWPQDKPLAMHAERQSVAVGIGLAATTNRPVHFCHISRREEIELIADAKAQGLAITCEVTPHHLTLNLADYARLGPLADMRPVLGTPSDVAALWEHIDDTVDCIATDHAPHTLEEKWSSQPPPGIAGLETSLPLMLTAVHDGRLSLERLVELMATNPRHIFGLPPQPQTWVEVDVDAQVTIANKSLHTKSGWTPFDGFVMHGRIEKTVLRGVTAYENGRLLAEPGSGRVFPEVDRSGMMHTASSPVFEAEESGVEESR